VPRFSDDLATGEFFVEFVKMLFRCTTAFAIFPRIRALLVEHWANTSARKRRQVNQPRRGLWVVGRTRPFGTILELPSEGIGSITYESDALPR